MTDTEKRLAEIRERCEAAKREKLAGNAVDCACLSWAVVLNDVPFLLSEIDRLTAENTEQTKRMALAMRDLKEAGAVTCAFCAYSEYNPMRGSYRGPYCPGSKSDCNGECVNWKWHGETATMPLPAQPDVDG